MNASLKNDDTDTVLEKMLQTYQSEEADYQNHWVWKTLGTTPKEFSAKANLMVEQSGVSRAEWQKRLDNLKRDVEGRVKQNQVPMVVNLAKYRALKV